ncbi:hypothetical protein ACJ41O_000941 [Fusarium nematophilum]
MKLSLAGQAVLTGLAAIVTADMLPPDDIPLMCVTICGPIVELTSKCDVHGQRLAKRNLEGAWVPKLAVEPPETEPLRVEARDQNDLEKRSFSIIRAAPTSFPPDLVAAPVDPETSTGSTSGMSIADQTSTWATSAPSKTVTTTTATPRSRGSTPSEVDTTTLGTGWNHNTQQNGRLYADEDPEVECVCKNDSFDVAKVAALCHDCIVLDGHKQNNMDIIMEGCNFTTLTYTPEQDSVVDNVRVEATRPTALAATQASSSTTNSGSTVRLDAGHRVALVIFVLGLITLL